MFDSARTALKIEPVVRRGKPTKARLEIDPVEAAFLATILQHSLGSVEQDIADEEMLKFSTFVQRLCGAVESLTEEIGAGGTSLARRTQAYKKVRKLFDPGYDATDA